LTNLQLGLQWSTEKYKLGWVGELGLACSVYADIIGKQSTVYAPATWPLLQPM